MKVKVANLGFPSLIDHLYSLYGCKSILKCISELKSCVKVKVDVLGSISLIVLTVSVDIKQH